MTSSQYQNTALSVPHDIITKIQPIPLDSDLSIMTASIATQIMSMSCSYSGHGRSFSHEQSQVERGRARALSTKAKPGILYQLETLLIPTGIKLSLKIKSSLDIYNLMKEVYNLTWDSNHKERFYVIALNRANNIIGIEQVAVGGFSGVLVDSKVIFQVLLGCAASGFICVHNHPSDNTKPSESDIALTKKLKEAGKVLDISLLDHIIYTSKKHFSFADDGLL